MNFNYNTLNVSLNTDTRSITVALNRPEHDNALNVEMLFELESLFGWLTSHLEVNALVLTGEGDTFCSGFDQNELKIMSQEKLQKYMVRFQKLVSGMLCLPQTVICDLKDGAWGMGIELALGADMRVSRTTAKLNFNSLDKGWVPCSGGVGLLSLWVGHGNARSWTLGSQSIGSEVMVSKGLVSQIYSTSEDALTPLLTKIQNQAPVARIQAKRSFLETIMPELVRAFEYETIFSFASMKTEDWKKDPKANPEEAFTTARELSQEIKSKVRPEGMV